MDTRCKRRSHTKLCTDMYAMQDLTEDSVIFYFYLCADKFKVSLSSMSVPKALRTHSECEHPRMFRVTRANITKGSPAVLRPDGVRSRSHKISFFISFFKQAVCKQDINYK